MGSFIIRRLVQAVLTTFGVMLLTFVLFRLVAGDVSAQFVNPKLGKEARVAWLRKNKLDLPMLLNLTRRLVITDNTRGDKAFSVRDSEGSTAVAAMVLEPVYDRDRNGDGPPETSAVTAIGGGPVQLLSRDTPLAEMTGNDPWTVRTSTWKEKPATEPAQGPSRPILVFALSDGSELTVDLAQLTTFEPGEAARPATTATCGDLLRTINGNPDNTGRVKAEISDVAFAGVFRSQFFHHLWDSVTFQNSSFKTNEKLLDIIGQRARFSLAISIPVLALGWLTAMAVSCVVAYYRASYIDKLGVFICVLGMCVPYLVYMIAGQALIFEIAPTAAWGLHNRANVFVPVAIALVAGLGGSVRFYRTVILDEVNRDYVRTARAKGVPLPGILFRHVLKNCMLPILTSLVVSIPFLIMGSLLLENFFGVPGLGSLMVSSVSDRDVPVISGLTFLTAAIYVLGLLITDVLYAVFDPRIRLR